jgi:hypothetical protein
MAQSASERNPFMLMLHPELILAAIEKSERLGQLNRHLCRPLDKVAPGTPGSGSDGQSDDETDEIVRSGQEVSI